MVVGDRIRAERMKRGWSQEDLAQRAYVSRPTISHWETERSLPDAQSLLILSQLYQTSIDELVKGDVGEMEQLVASEIRGSRGRILLVACVATAAASALVVTGLAARPMVGSVAQLGLACTCVSIAWTILSRGCGRALRARHAADVLKRIAPQAESAQTELKCDRAQKDRLLDEIARDGVEDPCARLVLAIASAVAIACALSWIATLVQPDLFL